jgi:hypothetical protein
MSNSTTLLDSILANSANKEALANALFDAMSPSSFGGRHASACSGLTWGYYGGNFQSGGTNNAVANGTLTLAASTTNYVQANPSTGAITSNTTGFTSGYVQLYTIVTGATTVTSYTDLRQAIGAAGASGTVTSVAATGGLEVAAPGNPAITGSGTVRETMLLAGGAVQTAAYTFVTGDRGKTLVMNSASAVSQALPAPTGTTATTNFPTGFFGWVENVGAGACTLSVPSGVSLDGVANGTLALNQNTGVGFFTDGTNYFTLRGAASGGGGFTNPMTTAGDMITGGSGGTAQRLGVGANGTVLSVVSGAPAWAAPSSSSPCAFIAGNTSTQSIPASTSTVITGWTAVQDNSNGAMNFSTGVFTAPYAGWYAVAGVFRTASAAFAAANQIVGNIVINGTTEMSSYVVVETSATANWGSAPVSGVFYLTAGQTISFAALQTSSAAVNLVSSMNGNVFSVAFVSAGVNVVPGTAPIALTTYYPGTPSASANLLRAVVPVACTFPASLTGSKAVCDVAPTSAVTCNITHNGTVVGSVNFAASATSGTFTFSSAVNNAAGDVWAVVAPASPDATFAGPAIALLASAPAVSSNTTLASLSDANITSPAAGQVLEYVSGKWTNTTPTLCAFSAVNTTTQSIPASTATTVTGWTAVEDNSGGAMNFSTGVFTAPVTGWYQINAQVAFASSAWTAGVPCSCILNINGSQGAIGWAVAWAAVTTPLVSNPACSLVYLTAGQTVSVQAFQGRSSATNLLGVSSYVFFNVALLTPTV